jgi:hypothetical protein
MRLCFPAISEFPPHLMIAPEKDGTLHSGRDLWRRLEESNFLWKESNCAVGESNCRVIRDHSVRSSNS